MAERVPKGTWVEVCRILLAPCDRAARVPAETQRVPLEMRVRGALAHGASLGDEVEVVTAAGRRQRGTLREVTPAYTHGFGPPVPELQAVGVELRALLEAEASG